MVSMDALPLVGHTPNSTQTQLYKAKKEEILKYSKIISPSNILPLKRRNFFRSSITKVFLLIYGCDR
jgi:hypothetical protein